MTTMLTRFGLTRDSMIWWIGMVTALVAGLATLTTGDASNPLSLGYYGIPDTWAPYIRLAALVLGIFSGKQATSALPGENDDKRLSMQLKVDGREIAKQIIEQSRKNGVALILVAALGAGAVGVSSCAKGPINQPQIEQATLKALDVVRRAGIVLEQAQLWEIQLHTDGIVKDAVHVQVQAAFGRAAESVQAALRKLPAIASATDQKALLRATADAIREIVTVAGHLSDTQAQRLALLIGSAQALVELAL